MERKRVATPQEIARKLVTMPALKSQLSLVIPNDDSREYEPIPPTEERVRGVMQACREALHFGPSAKRDKKVKSRR